MAWGKRSWYSWMTNSAYCFAHSWFGWYQICFELRAVDSLSLWGIWTTIFRIQCTLKALPTGSSETFLKWHFSVLHEQWMHTARLFFHSSSFKLFKEMSIGRIYSANMGSTARISRFPSFVRPWATVTAMLMTCLSQRTFS
jgi:hypothetical protein